MYAIRANHRKLTSYVQKKRIRTIRFDETLDSYVCDNGVKRKGLLRSLKYLYYPRYERKLRHGRKRPSHGRYASSRQQGILIDHELSDYVTTRVMPTHPMASGVVHFLEDVMKHTVEGAQIPLIVMVNGKERITQADLISQDARGRLWMWEIKSGWNQAQAQGTLKRIQGAVPNKDHNHWELQRHYTHQGLVKCGLAIYKSHVLNVFQEHRHIVVQRRSVPKWCSTIHVEAPCL